MGLFTSLSQEQLAAVAAAFAWGPVRGAVAIAAGTVNSNYCVDTDDGRWFVRVNEGQTDGDIEWEAWLTRALEGQVPLTVPLQTRSGQPFARVDRLRISAFPWRSGRHLAPSEVDAVSARQVGRGLADLHRAGQLLPRERWRPSRYGLGELDQRLARVSAAARPELKAVLAELHAARAEVAASGMLAGSTQPDGIIHGDLFRDNVLWDDGRLAALLDFEQASQGRFAYDLAVVLLDWCWDDVAAGPREHLFADAIAAYRGAATPNVSSAVDLAGLANGLIAASWRFTITRLTDVYLPGHTQPGKDFRDFYRRLHFFRSHRDALARLCG